MPCPAGKTQGRHGDQLSAGVRRQLAKNSDIRQIQLIYRTNHVDDADVLAALRAIRDSEANGAVLMHCKHGSDRTGLMAAMYRVVVQGGARKRR